ncbi:MAG: hypothetical protein HC802_23085 [Caldilineaceae bacterium]|nr:hypothetical protein [Caldilineaceae bacterium]
MLGRDIKGADDAFLLHDEMEEINDPVYFREFIQHAEQHGLHYLADAEFRTVFPFDIPQETMSYIQSHSRDTIELEQYLDFLRNRMFRQTLLCRADAQVDRVLEPSRIVDLYVSSQAKPSSVQPDIQNVTIEQFKSNDGGVLTTDHPVTKAAMMILREHWPAAIGLEKLLELARGRLGRRADRQGDRRNRRKQSESERNELNRDRLVLADNLLRAFAYSTQLVKLSAFTPNFTTTVSRRPIASPVARTQAVDGAVVTSLQHDRVRLTDVQRVLLPLLDGSRDRTALLDELASRAVATGPAADPTALHSLRNALATDLDLHLRYFAEFSLLIG